MISPRKGNSLDPGVAFGMAFRQARTIARLTQEQAAHAAGLDRTYISLLERGLRQPTIRVIFALATVVHTTPTALILTTEKFVAID
jgi:transcriptional regulator with XRE-family HTH domain